MNKIFWQFMVFVAFLNSGSVYGMNKKMESSRESLLGKPEVARANAVFGDFGIIAAGELLIKDNVKMMAQKKSLRAFQKLMRNVDDYEYIERKVKESIELDINTLCFIFGDGAFGEYVNIIKEVCKDFVQLSEKKKYHKQAQEFFAKTNLELAEYSSIRHVIKQVLLEKQVSNLLTKYQKEAVINFWHAGFKVNKKKAGDLSYISLFCIEQMASDSIKNNAQQFFCDFCYQFSIYAWAKNQNADALEYGKKAYSKAVEWGVGSSNSRTSLRNWLDEISEKKNEEYLIETKPIFGKRKLPNPKKYEKRQKMFNE